MISLFWPCCNVESYVQKSKAYNTRMYNFDLCGKKLNSSFIWNDKNKDVIIFIFSIWFAFLLRVLPRKKTELHDASVCVVTRQSSRDTRSPLDHGFPLGLEPQ